MESEERPIQPFLDMISASFARLSDPRVCHKVSYSLEEVLFLVYCSSVCDMPSYEEIHDFGEDRLDWLRKYLPYQNGIPSHDTINRVMGLIDTRELERMLSDVANYEIVLPDGCIVSIDGKWLGRSATVRQQQTKKSDGGRQACMMVNAYSASHSWCIASVEVAGKSGEIHAVGGILRLLDLSGCLLTMDAGYCSKDTAKQVKEAGADYLMGLKGNQPLLHELAQCQFEKGVQSSQFQTLDTGHGREERRLCTALNISDIAELGEPGKKAIEGWPSLRSLIQIESWVLDTVKGIDRHEKRLYISSMLMDAKQAASAVREHWRIENSLHWVLDVCLGEDQSTKRSMNSAANFSLFRKIGLNRLQAWDPGMSKKISIKRKQNKCMANTKNLEEVLGFF
jgi:predicted transposase YbfD/YdcC